MDISCMFILSLLEYIYFASVYQFYLFRLSTFWHLELWHLLIWMKIASFRWTQHFRTDQ